VSKKGGVWTYFTAGVWVIIFAIVPTIILELLIVGGVLALNENPVMLILFCLAIIFASIIIGGWTAISAVNRVRR
jgi:hypothetical protein